MGGCFGKSKKENCDTDSEESVDGSCLPSTPKDQRRRIPRASEYRGILEFLPKGPYAHQDGQMPIRTTRLFPRTSSLLSSSSNSGTFNQSFISSNSAPFQSTEPGHTSGGFNNFRQTQAGLEGSNPTPLAEAALGLARDQALGFAQQGDGMLFPPASYVSTQNHSSEISIATEQDDQMPLPPASLSPSTTSLPSSSNSDTFNQPTTTSLSTPLQPTQPGQTSGGFNNSGQMQPVRSWREKTSNIMGACFGKSKEKNRDTDRQESVDGSCLPDTPKDQRRRIPRASEYRGHLEFFPKGPFAQPGEEMLFRPASYVLSRNNNSEFSLATEATLGCDQQGLSGTNQTRLHTLENSQAEEGVGRFREAPAYLFPSTSSLPSSSNSGNFNQTATFSKSAPF